MTLFRRNHLERTARPAALASVYITACWIMLAPICNFAKLGTATYQGDARLVVWALAWDNHSVLTGLRSLASVRALASLKSFFDANTFYPTPGALAYGEHFFGISLFSLPIYWLTRNPVLGYNVVWILSYVLAACAAHYLAWRLTQDHLASTVAGLTYAFCFFRMHHGHGHLHLLWGFWIPLSLIAMERWIATQSWWRLWLLVAILVLQALSSWYQAVMIFVADALFMSWLVVLEPLLDKRWSWTWQRMSRLLIQFIAGTAAALLMVWPFARYYHALARGSVDEMANASADLTAFLMPPENTYLGQWLIRSGVKGPRWIWGELTLYLGWTTLALGIAGAALAVRGPEKMFRRFRYFVLLALVAFALAAGPSAREVADNAWHWSAFGLLARIPGANLFRAPARFSALLTLALAMLAGGACARLHAQFGRAGRLATIIAIPVILFEFYVVDFPAGRPVPSPVPAVYRLIASLPAGAIVSLPDYAATPQWFKEADYQFFSTAHWHPIANGYSRATPAGFTDRMERLATFPDAAALASLRETRIRYVVVHADQYPAGAGVVAQALSESALTPMGSGCRLLARFGADYLFAIDE